LRTLLVDGVLGRPLLALCHTTWFREQAYFDVPWRGRWATEGGGPTMGHGIHQMDLLTAVLGDWVRVSAVARQQARRTETEDVSLAHIAFASGAIASVVNSVVSPREESYLRFDFERCTVELTHLYGYGDDDWRITPAPGYEEPVLAAWKGSAPAPAGAGLAEAKPVHDAQSGVRSGHQAQFAAVLAALRAGEPPPVTSGDAARTMRLVAGIYASAFSGQAVRADDLVPPSPFYGRMNGTGERWDALIEQRSL
jgi:predicted dehydrogenase